MELPDLFLIVDVPDGDRAVRTTAEAHLTVRTDRERVAGRRLRRQFGLDARRGRAEVPDRDYARLTADDQRTVVRQQLAGPNVVVTLQALQGADRLLWLSRRFRGAYVPDFHAACQRKKRSAIVRNRQEVLAFRNLAPKKADLRRREKAKKRVSTFAAGVDESGWVTDRDRADHFAMLQHLCLLRHLRYVVRLFARKDGRL